MSLIGEKMYIENDAKENDTKEEDTKEIIKEDEFIFYKEGNKIKSCGLDINSHLLKSNMGVGLKCKDLKKDEEDKVEKMFENLMIPSGLIYMKFKQSLSPHSQDNNNQNGKIEYINDTIDDTIYDELYKLVSVPMLENNDKIDETSLNRQESSTDEDDSSTDEDESSSDEDESSSDEDEGSYDEENVYKKEKEKEEEDNKKDDKKEKEENKIKYQGGKKRNKTRKGKKIRKNNTKKNKKIRKNNTKRNKKSNKKTKTKKR